MRYLGQPLKQIFDTASKKRKEDTKKLFSEERKRTNVKDKNKRKSLVSENEKWEKCFQKISNKHKNAYKKHTFMMRYHFIGEQNINNITNKFFYKDAELNFRRDIEPIYQLTAKINLVMHCFLEQMPKNVNDKIKLPDDKETEKIRHIRDNVAHNGLFWNTADKNSGFYTVQEVFEIIMKAVLITGDKERMNDFYSRISKLFEKEKYAIVDKKNDHTIQPLHVKRWTEENRQEYISDKYDVDKRKELKNRIGSWMRDLKNAKQSVLNVEKNKKQSYKKVA